LRDSRSLSRLWSRGLMIKTMNISTWVAYILAQRHTSLI